MSALSSKPAQLLTQSTTASCFVPSARRGNCLLLRKPLTLRMLFELYAPQKLAMELNLFELLCAFWDQRVVRDNRAGTWSRIVLTISAMLLLSWAFSLPLMERSPSPRMPSLRCPIALGLRSSRRYRAVGSSAEARDLLSSFIRHCWNTRRPEVSIGCVDPVRVWTRPTR